MLVTLSPKQSTHVGASLSVLKSPSTLQGAAVEELRRRIIMGDFPPDSPLKDTEIATALGLSNTPVREAFVTLAAEGLIDIIPNKSKRVSPINNHAMVDLLMVQSHLWELGYQWGGKHVGSKQLEQLKHCVDSQRQAMAAGEVLTAVNASQEFHLVLMAASGNQELVRVSVDRMPLIQRFVILQMPWLPSEEMLDIHECMYQEFVKQNPENAIVLFRQACGALIKDVIKIRDN